jgi:hypothetical protein
VETPEIEAGLKRIRVRQHRMKHLLCGFIPFVMTAAWVNHAPSDEAITAFIVAAVAYGALLLWYSLRLAFTDCPRCHGYYHCNWWLDPWAGRCLHCGLPRGEM